MEHRIKLQLLVSQSCFPLTLVSSSIIEQDVGESRGRFPPMGLEINPELVEEKNVHRILKSPEEDTLYSLGVVGVEVKDGFL